MATEISPPGGNQAVKSPARARQLVVWVVAALVTSALLLATLRREGGPARGRSVPIGNPQAGADLFQRKGCVDCHGTQGTGGGVSLASDSARPSRWLPDQLVVAMWNHAPRMWQRMAERQRVTPKLDEREMADLLAFMALVQSVDDDGDPGSGRRIYEAKGCSGCHPEAGAAGRSHRLDVLRKRASPVAWAQAMWNHPSVPGRTLLRIQSTEMADLLAFVRGGQRAPVEPELMAADSRSGWRLFRVKGCVSCHPVRDEAGNADLLLGSPRSLPATFGQLSGVLWNHAVAMSERGIPLESSKALGLRETADIIAFLYSSRTGEPGGSARRGEVLWEARGCAGCHGDGAQGGARGPRLRGRGQSYATVSFAAALWRHGPTMYRQAREAGLRWPDLAEGDVGDLITFLNSSPGGSS